ncbi:MAG: hypothetical protein HT580_05355 [Dechloromonas sp.]|nr:MAG: hypothetical protein HT580_05355 [Dechloromonas sp.]
MSDFFTETVCLAEMLWFFKHEYSLNQMDIFIGWIFALNVHKLCVAGLRLPPGSNQMKKESVGNDIEKLNPVRWKD